MATFQSPNISQRFPLCDAASNDEVIAHASFSLTTAPLVADVYQMLRIPAGHIITGGLFSCGLVDTNGAPTFTLELGYVADPDHYGMLGPLNNAAVPGVHAAGVNLWPLAGLWATESPQVLAEDTLLSLTCTAAPATFGTPPLPLNLWVTYTRAMTVGSFTDL